MAKYMCSCGVSFSKEKDTKEHLSTHQKLSLACAFSDGEIPHFIIKRDYLTRFLEWSQDWYSPFWWRFAGFIMVHGAFVFHFRYNIYESLLSGFGLGMLIPTWLKDE